MHGVTPAGRHWQTKLGNSSGQQTAPGPQSPLQVGTNVSPHGVPRVMVVVLVVVVVVVTVQPPLPHASQQLGADPTHTCPPLGALHDDARRFTVHLVVPFDFVRQHVTAPGFPQVERAAQRRTADWHCGGSWWFAARSVATAAAQLT